MLSPFASTSLSGIHSSLLNSLVILNNYLNFSVLNMFILSLNIIV